MYVLWLNMGLHSYIEMPMFLLFVFFLSFLTFFCLLFYFCVYLLIATIPLLSTIYDGVLSEFNPQTVTKNLILNLIFFSFNYVALVTFFLYSQTNFYRFLSFLLPLIFILFSCFVHWLNQFGLNYYSFIDTIVAFLYVLNFSRNASILALILVA